MITSFVELITSFVELIVIVAGIWFAWSAMVLAIFVIVVVACRLVSGCLELMGSLFRTLDCIDHSVWMEALWWVVLSSLAAVIGYVMSTAALTGV